MDGTMAETDLWSGAYFIQERISGWWIQPLWKIWVQVSWDYCSQLFMESHNPFMFQSPPTRYTSCRRGSAYHRDFCPTAKWPKKTPVMPAMCRDPSRCEPGTVMFMKKVSQSNHNHQSTSGSCQTKVAATWCDMVPLPICSCPSMLSGMTMVIIVVANIALITMTNNTIYNTIIIQHNIQHISIYIYKQTYCYE